MQRLDLKLQLLIYNDDNESNKHKRYRFVEVDDVYAPGHPAAVIDTAEFT